MPRLSAAATDRAQLFLIDTIRLDHSLGERNLAPVSEERRSPSASTSTASESAPRRVDGPPRRLPS